MFVTHIVDASHYFVRILGVRNEDTEDSSLRDESAKYSRLQLDLGQWFGNLLNRKRHSK